MKKQINYKDIVIDETIYPRHLWHWQVAYDYSESMKMGDKFPPIVVADYRGVFILVDGKHRLEAMRIALGKKKATGLKVDCEVLKGLSKKQIYEQAIKYNIKHGQKFTVQDRLKIAITLKDLNFSAIQISKLVKISTQKLTGLIAKRVTSSVTGEPFIVKKPFEDVKDTKPDMEFLQNRVSGSSQLQAIEQVITLLKTKTIDRKNPKIKVALKILKKLL